MVYDLHRACRICAERVGVISTRFMVANKNDIGS
ncbi:Uncharacterised protein [Vibrio cholerae]|nr:Uncharacterised protein [Vibrio cholerae]CSI56815.1 Uncharacterised protein [Vibrio cholerae]